MNVSISSWWKSQLGIHVINWIGVRINNYLNSEGEPCYLFATCSEEENVWKRWARDLGPIEKGDHLMSIDQKSFLPRTQTTTKANFGCFEDEKESMFVTHNIFQYLSYFQKNLELRRGLNGDRLPCQSMSSYNRLRDLTKVMNSWTKKRSPFVVSIKSMRYLLCSSPKDDHNQYRNGNASIQRAILIDKKDFI